MRMRERKSPCLTHFYSLVPFFLQVPQFETGRPEDADGVAFARLFPEGHFTTLSQIEFAKLAPAEANQQLERRKLNKLSKPKTKQVKKIQEGETFEAYKHGEEKKTDEVCFLICQSTYRPLKSHTAAVFQVPSSEESITWIFIKSICSDLHLERMTEFVFKGAASITQKQAKEEFVLLQKNSGVTQILNREFELLFQQMGFADNLSKNDWKRACKRFIDEQAKTAICDRG